MYGPWFSLLSVYIDSIHGLKSNTEHIDSMETQNSLTLCF